MGEIAAIYVNQPLVQMGPCWKCGVVYAVPENFKKARLEDNTRNFYCPNGHSSVFTESSTAKLQRQLETARSERDWARKGRDKAQRSASAFKGKVTELKNRVRNGVCPFCKRSFVNLKRHMDTKHPDHENCEIGES